ncbi:MAG: DUF5309 domain-containing protein [Bacteroidales bacterium]|nr:DUF5309 domain-containing protein [Bacteroidales bacterium]
MAEVTGVGTTWNLPNYAGDLFTAAPTQTPFLSMIGGLTSGGMQTENYEFPTGVIYDLPAASQPDISESASTKAPESVLIARDQETNVVQIHHETIDLTYAKLSNMGRLSGVNTANVSANPQDEEAWQIQQKLIKIARDVEYSFLQGKYQKATSADVSNKTRGMIELCSSDAGTHVDAGGSVLTIDLLQELYRDMADNGAVFQNMVMFCGSYNKQMLTNIYAALYGFNTPATRNVGGYNIQSVVTDFCDLGIVWDPFMPDDTILLADMAQIAPVFQPVPQKGNFFVEPLAKEGATNASQIYGQIGLAHGPAFLHGVITGLATSGSNGSTDTPEPTSTKATKTA